MYRLEKRFFLILAALCFIFSAGAEAQNLSTASTSGQAPTAVQWAIKAVQALTGGVPVSSVNMQGTVMRGDTDGELADGIVLQATGTLSSQVNITTSNGSISFVRSTDDAGRPSGSWIGQDGVTHVTALHNCWTDSVWFFPALSILSSYADARFVLTDVGQEQRNGISVEHLQVYRNVPSSTPQKTALTAKLSTVDYYLESSTAVPIAMVFADHPDSDLLTNIPTEIDFGNYQLVGSRLVPYQIDRLQNGNPQYRITLTSATIN